MDKKYVEITDKTRAFIRIGESYYEVHEQVEGLVRLLLKRIEKLKRLKKGQANERFEA